VKVTTSTLPREALIDPACEAWASASADAVSLSPVPLDAQPNAYIQVAWANRPFGTTPEVSVAALADDERLYVRLEWDDDPSPNGEFADAAGLLLGDGNIASLGSAEQPLELWYWAEDRDEPLALLAAGPGVFSRNGGTALDATASLEGGRWRVVLAGPRVSLTADNRLGVAIWNGSNEERAGLAAVSEWLSTETEANQT
jgi:DMSO reductase family type II enzyme heme b subunit